MAQLDFREWEPNSADDWVSRDPMRELPALMPLTQSGRGLVFDAWSRLPPRYRQRVWREREIAKYVYDLSRSWSDIPGIRAIGVGRRQVGNRRRLVAIVTFEILVPLEVDLFYQQYEIPRLINVNSSIPLDTLEDETEEVPVVIEYEPAPIRLQLGIVPPNQYVMLSDTSTQVLATPTLQAGDAIAGENSAGFRTPGTLTAIVSHQGDTAPLLLSAAHVLETCGWKVIVQVPSPQCVGQVIETDKNLDAAIAALESPWQVDYRIKAIDLVPAAPIWPYSDMPVQFVGGMSGHQQGWLDVVNSIPVGGERLGIVPHFRATTLSQRGDSGALLLSGHGTASPIPEAFSMYTSADYQESLTCAMLGLLIAGPSTEATTVTRAQTYFTPIIMILSHFGLQGWVRQFPRWS